MAWVDPTTLGMNLWIIIGGVLLAAFLLVALLVVWTAAKMGLWHWRKSRAAQRQAGARLGPDGRPYPPAARGLCDRCGRICDAVYHLPSGQRRCPACYAHPEDEP